MQRGEIYFVDLDPVRGREQSGRRPVVIVSIDEVNQLPLVVTVVPGTDSRNVRGRGRFNVWTTPNETGLPRDTVFLCFQIRSLDHSRLSEPPVGVLAPYRMQEIEAAIRALLGLH